MDEIPPQPDPREPSELYLPPKEPGVTEFEAPHWSLWLVYLFLRPGLFFKTFVIHPVPFLTVLGAWMYGVANAMDRIETRIQFPISSNPIYEHLGSSWGVFWGACLGLGVIGGAFFYFLGGWWYRLRVKWCGANDPDRSLARRVYMFSSQVYVVPYLIYTAWSTTAYATPTEAMMGEDYGALIVLVMLFWSIYVSYRGVRTAFKVLRWRARIWFLALPTLVYAVAFAAIIAALFATGALDEPPDLENPVTIEREGFTLSYPGNWEVDTLDPDYDPDSSFSIGPPLDDAQISFWFYELPMDSVECADETRWNLQSVYEFDPVRSDRWGAFDGAGYRGVASIEGLPYDVFVFCATDGTQPFEIMIVTDEDVRDLVQPGYDLIRDSLRLTLPVNQAALRSDGSSFNSDSVSWFISSLMDRSVSTRIAALPWATGL